MNRQASRRPAVSPPDRLLTCRDLAATTMGPAAGQSVERVSREMPARNANGPLRRRERR